MVAERDAGSGRGSLEMGEICGVMGQKIWEAGGAKGTRSKVSEKEERMN